MPQYVIRQGGISLGKAAGQMGVPLVPALPGEEPTVIELDEAEAAQINAGANRLRIEGSKPKPPPLQLLREYKAELAGETARSEAIERARAEGRMPPQTTAEVEALARKYEADLDAKAAQLRAQAAEVQKHGDEARANIAKAHAELEQKWKDLEAREAAVKKAEDDAKSSKHGKGGK